MDKIGIPDDVPELNMGIPATELEFVIMMLLTSWKMDNLITQWNSLLRELRRVNNERQG
jgi:hypothetical protein